MSGITGQTERREPELTTSTLLAMTDGQRTTLGLITIGMAVAGVVGIVGDAETGWPQILLRVAIVLGAIWLAAPGFHRVPRRVAVGIAAGITVVAFRPRLVLAGVVVAAAVMVLWRRGSTG